MILQHGNDSTAYRQAYELSRRSVELDSTNGSARWLTVASYDRYLLSKGQAQWYGTQYLTLNGTTYLRPIDTTQVSDAERDESRPFRLISRRLPNVYNSSGRDIEALHKGRRHNTAFMNPEDAADRGLEAGAVVRIESEHASILGIVELAPELRRGVVSMSHCFGDGPESDGEVRAVGSNTGRLVSVERDYDPYTGIPRMSAIPVAIERWIGAR